MPEKRIPFTLERLKKLPPAQPGKRDEYYDEGMPSLLLRVTDKGTKTFQVRKRTKDGKTARVTLERFPGMTPELARRQAQKVLAQLAGGIDPTKAKRVARASKVTFEEAFNTYISKRSLKPRTEYNYRRQLDTDLADLKAKPLTDITRDLVLKTHKALSNKDVTKHCSSGGKYSANGAMRVMRAVFNFAKGEYLGEDGRSLFPDNPVQSIAHARSWNKEKRRDSYIQPTQMKPWFDAVLTLEQSGEPMASTWRDFLLLTLLTGLRKNEALTLKWEYIDFAERAVHIPDTNTKNSEPHSLPLSDYLLDLLRQRKENAAEKSEYVFPNPYTLEKPGVKEKHLGDVKAALRHVTAASGVAFIIHDLRRTFLTYGHSLNINELTLKRLVNHKTAARDATPGYIVSNVESLREPMQRITNHLLQLAGVIAAPEKSAIQLVYDADAAHAQQAEKEKASKAP